MTTSYWKPFESTPRTERREAVRAYGAFPLRLRAQRPDGFNIDAVADNVSRDGVHTHVNEPIAVDTAVIGVVRLPMGSAIAGRGRVVRVESLADGRCGVAVQFTAARLTRNTRD